MQAPCLVCAVQPFIWLGRLCGYFPIQCECSSKYTSSKFQKSSIWISASLIVLASIGIHLGFTCYEFFVEVVVDKTVIDWVLFVAEFVHHATSFLLLIFNLIQLNVRLEAYNEISYTIHSEGLNAKRSMTAEDEINLRKSGMREVLLVICILVLENIMEYYFHNELDPEFIIVNIFGALISTLSEAIILMQSLEFSITTNTLRYLITSVKLHFEEILDKAVSCNRVERLNVQSLSITFQLRNDVNGLQALPRVNFCDELGKTRQRYGKVMKCLRSLNNCMNPQLLVSIVSTMICLVLISYAAVRCAGKQSVDLFFCNVLFKVIIEVSAMFYVVKLSEDLLKTAEIFFGELVTTMSDALTYHELTQLVSFLEQLGNTPPLFSASGIIDLNASVVSSMAATLVTYVLVALQFDTS